MPVTGVQTCALPICIVADTIEGRGEIIDSEEQVGGYPVQNESHQPFNEKDWDLATMTFKTAPTSRNTPR